MMHFIKNDNILNFDLIFQCSSIAIRINIHRWMINISETNGQSTLLKSHLSFSIKLMVEACDKFNWMLYYLLRKHAAGECTFCNNPKIESLWIFLHVTTWLWNTTFDFRILTLHTFSSFSLYPSFTFFLFTSFRKLLIAGFCCFELFL